MTPDDLKKRTKQFGLRIIKLVESLPNSKAANVIGNQLLSCATSVGSNYRSACRARSKKDFISKIGIVEEEADESAYWLEVLIEAGIVRPKQVAELLAEANELTAIMASSRKTAKSKR